MFDSSPVVSPMRSRHVLMIAALLRPTAFSEVASLVIACAIVYALLLSPATAQSLPEPTHALDKPVTSPPLVCGCPSGTSKGDISITTTYQDARISKHFLGNGDAVARGRVRAHTLALAVDYSMTERLAMSASLPYVVSSYHGNFPHQFPIDNGEAHGTYQDYRVDLRYVIPFAPIALTPFVGLVIPSHNYTYFGHSAAGRHLHEQSAGVNIGRILEPLIPNTYVQVRYAYTFSEKVVGISHNRSNLDADVSYFIVPSLSIRALGSLQKTYSLLNIDGLVHSGPLWTHHDQILRDNYVNAGAGVSYALTDAVDVFAVGLRTLSGRNGHKIDLSTNVGVTWTFHSAKGSPEKR
jgi:hypothetical protein